MAVSHAERIQYSYNLMVAVISVFLCLQEHMYYRDIILLRRHQHYGKVFDWLGIGLSCCVKNFNARVGNCRATDNSWGDGLGFH